MANKGLMTLRKQVAAQRADILRHNLGKWRKDSTGAQHTRCQDCQAYVYVTSLTTTGTACTFECTTDHNALRER